MFLLIKMNIYTHVEITPELKMGTVDTEYN